MNRALIVDCGQGDCILIQKNNHQTLIDCGEYYKKPWSKTKRILSWYIQKGRDKNLDCIITHFHSDHYGGFVKLLREYNFGSVNLYLHNPPGFPVNNSPKFVELTEEIEQISDRVEVIDALPLDIDGLLVKSYYPDPAIPVPLSRGYNDTSIVFSVTFGEAIMVLTGDSCEVLNGPLRKAIKKDTKGKFVILKVSHHGSITGTKRTLVKELKPNISFISVGNPNRYDRRYPGSMPHMPTVGLLGKPGNHRNKNSSVYYMTEPRSSRHYFYVLDFMKTKMRLSIKNSSNNRLVDQVIYEYITCIS